MDVARLSVLTTFVDRLFTRSLFYSLEDNMLRLLDRDSVGLWVANSSVSFAWAVISVLEGDA